MKSRAGHERPFDVRVGKTVPDQHELLGILERQRPEQHGVGHAEDGNVAADPEGERQHQHRGVPGPLDEAPKGVAKVLPEKVHELTLMLCTERRHRSGLRWSTRPPSGRFPAPINTPPASHVPEPSCEVAGRRPGAVQPLPQADDPGQNNKERRTGAGRFGTPKRTPTPPPYADPRALGAGGAGTPMATRTATPPQDECGWPSERGRSWQGGRRS